MQFGRPPSGFVSNWGDDQCTQLTDPVEITSVRSPSTIAGRQYAAAAQGVPMAIARAETSRLTSRTWPPRVT